MLPYIQNLQTLESAFEAKTIHPTKFLLLH